MHAKVSVTWKYKTPEGAGDTHYSIMRGTKANLVIEQGRREQNKPTLYIEPVGNTPYYMIESGRNLSQKFPGIELKKSSKGWELVIPEKYKEGHETHFALVSKVFGISEK